MANKLLIVESPGKIKKLSKILGPEWLVKASVGHIRELASDGNDSLGFDIDGQSIRCRFVPRGESGLKVIKGLRAAVRQVKTVVIATDPDREGETIAWHIQEALKLKNPQRVVYSQITPAAVRAAIAQPRQIDLNLVHSGLCRTVLDKLVGYRGSPLLWKLNNGAKSMGRVQSAALHILCAREREIQAFEPQDYWSVFVDYAEGFRAYYQGSTADSDEEETTDDAENPTESSAKESTRVISVTEADRLVEIAQQHPHQVKSIEGKTTRRKPPPAFITSSLQQTAGSRLRFSPEHTMKVAQSLYEAGLITYMRTDSTMLSPEFCSQARQWLENHDADNVPEKVAKHRKTKGAQEAHEAIRPTDIFKSSQTLKKELTANAFKLYVMIWKRAIASRCKPAQVQQTKINIQSGTVCWQAKGQVVSFYGYTRYWNNLKADAELPSVQQGQVLTLERAAHEQKQTQPPPRYSEPKLVQTMERRGIGRPSTYAPTIKTLKQRSYVEAAKSSLSPTQLGLEVDAFLGEALPDLLESAFTAQMEQALDQIAEGQEEWQRYLAGWNQNYFVPALTQAQQIVSKHCSSGSTGTSDHTLEVSKVPCPQCQKPMAKVPSTKVTKKYFLKCQNGCENTVLFYSKYSKQWEPPREKTSDGPRKKAATTEITKHLCPVCQKPMEAYSYKKDGKDKKLLRCSDEKARQQKKHKEAVYFFTSKGVWWSPKYGEMAE
ncbi:DNA topoisomerase I [Synechococcus sp. PCC 7335]|uniref:type I DNA topoisomerase n=1 Tax=Synechococcus sp. (strain ATCC 29403 / PCC 7335) TaxID=91464 RepID=UPI00017EB561|nr:type I DNA topoisomerase [Synechococcus sp. PCC 7335]EDX82448.1 DNA topoisomerase I [Synechococcus sp. PCC 7335]